MKDKYIVSLLVLTVF